MPENIVRQRINASASAVLLLVGLGTCLGMVERGGAYGEWSTAGKRRYTAGDEIVDSGGGGKPSEASSSRRSWRYVVTFNDGNGLEQYLNYTGIQIRNAVVDKWYGRRVVLRFDDKSNAQLFMDSTDEIMLEMGNVDAVEEDLAMLGKQIGHKNYTLSWAMDAGEPYGMSMWMNGLWNGGTGVVVASLDSGLSPSVLDSFQHLQGGYDFVSDPTMSLDGDGRDADWADPGDSVPGRCEKSSWHGTLTGAMLACDPSRAESGYAGVVPNATFMPVRVLGACMSGYASDVADAIVWAAGGDIRGLDARAAKQAQVILMAFSGYSGEAGCPSYLQSAVDLALARNITLVASGGNNYNDTVSNYFPGNCMGVYAVGALNRKGRFSSYTNRDASLYFPGGDV
jgi:hypothetical protein